MKRTLTLATLALGCLGCWQAPAPDDRVHVVTEYRVASGARVKVTADLSPEEARAFLADYPPQVIVDYEEAR